MSKKNTYEYVKEYFYQKGCTLLEEEYFGNKVKMKYICKNNHINTIRFNDFKSGYGCSICSGIKKLSYEFVLSQFKKMGYKLLSKEYKGTHSPLDCICNNGHKIKISYSSINSGCRCIICSGKNKHSYINIKNEFKKYKYELLSKEYKNNKTKLKYKCPNGHIGTVLWNNFQQGTRCSICNSSKGEEKIKLFLEKNKIKFEKEKKFQECKNKRCLPFDFYLPEHNILIEYQGEHHYKVLNDKFFGDEKELQKRKFLDKIKQNFAKDKNFNFIEIKYSNFNNIENILTKELGI